MGATLAERFPNLWRHMDVLRASWSAENEASRTRRAYSDAEFLPAALEIMEKPPSPGLRILLLSLCGMFALAVAWSFIGRVDVVAVATGKTVPAANVKIIQPIEIGSVRAIHVRNGQRVRRGQLLIELDPTMAGADQSQERSRLNASQLASVRNQALLSYFSGQPTEFVAPAGSPKNIADAQQAMLRAAIAEYEAERASLVQARAERASELAAAQAEIDKLEGTLPLVDQQVKARQQLADKGYFSKLKLLEYQQLRREHAENIRVQRAGASRARAAMANIDAQITKLRQTLLKSSAADLVAAQDESTMRAETVRKAERRLELQELRSPIDGMVQQLAVATIGGIVEPAQPLMVVVPMSNDIEVEAEIENKDIGFVREGQPVRVKFDAYPFTDFGVIDAQVVSVSRDAIEKASADAIVSKSHVSGSGATRLMYAARIRLAVPWIIVDGKRRRLGPGLAVQAEVKTGTRRIIYYLLSPLVGSVSEAGRER